MVEVIVTHKLVRVSSPYHPEFPSLARSLQGEWDKTHRRWTFPADMEEHVRELLLEIYGMDSDDYVAVKVVYRISSDEAAGTQIFALGRQLARRTRFNAAVRLGKEVSVLEGAFPQTGGSPAKPRLGGEGSYLLVQNVPLLLAEQAKADSPDHVKIG